MLGVYINLYMKISENRDHRMTASDSEIKAEKSSALLLSSCHLIFIAIHPDRVRRANEERNMRKIPCKIVRK